MKPKILNFGVDSLDVRTSRNRQPSAWLLEQLPQWREHRQAFYEKPKGWKPLLVELPEIGTFRVINKNGFYEFHLANDEICDIRIWNPENWGAAIGGETGQFYFAFASRFLQFNGTDAALELMERAVNILMGSQMYIGSSLPTNLEFTRTSNIDLFCDIELPKGISYKDISERFSCKARKRDAFFDAVGTTALEQAVQKYMQSPAKSRHKSGKKSSPLLNNKGGDSYAELIAQGSGVAVTDVQKVIQTQRKMYLALQVPEAPVSRVLAGGNRVMQTAYFGRFGSELFARIYDKDVSLNCQGKEYMREIWTAAGWNGTNPVWRVEFSLSGDFLRATEGVNGLPDLRPIETALAATPALWAYLSGTWLKHHKPSKDSNVSRWETSEMWTVVQGAFNQMQPIVRIQLEPKPVYGQVMAQAMGCLVAAQAMHESPCYQRSIPIDPETGEVLDPTIQFNNLLFEALSSPEHAQKILEKAARYGLDDLSDTAYRATVRSQHLALGRGS